MPDPVCRESAAGTRPGYDEAVEAMTRLARAPRCSDWGEGLNEPRVRALLDAAYPTIAAAVRDDERVAMWEADLDAAAVGIRADERRRIVAALRNHPHSEGHYFSFKQAADLIEERFA